MQLTYSGAVSRLGEQVTVNSVWAIYNRNYVVRCFVAADRDEAIALAHKAGHMRHPSYVRRTDDVTASMLEEHGEAISVLLDCGKTGLLENDGTSWVIRS